MGRDDSNTERSTMRINRTERTASAAGARATKSANSPSGSFRLDGANDPRQAQSAGGPRAVAAVDGLLSLQEVPDASARRRRAIKRGEDLLDVLDDIKLGLLAGMIPLPKVRQLIVTVENQRDEVSDPDLARVLDEIELRARVELAKLGKTAA